MKNNKGQAAILIIFVIGMVGLLIGMSLSKTGFAESMMGRGVAGSTYAFYVANSGVEDAFYKIQEHTDTDEDGIGFGYPDPVNYPLDVGEGTAKITISGTKNERIIESVGKFEKYVRKLRVITYNTSIKPGFADAIHASNGGVELEGNTKVTGNVYSNSFVKGVNNGHAGRSDCSDDQPASVTGIEGNVWAVDSIDKLASINSGPCIHGSAFSKDINECRILGSAYSDDSISDSSCPYEIECDPDENPDCITPIKKPLPDIGEEMLKQYLVDNNNIYAGDCEIGGTNNCSTPSESDGITPTIGNIIIEGNLITNIPLLYISGPVWVKGNINMESNQTIDLDPGVTDKSLILFADGKILADSNITFNSEGTKFLLLVSGHENSEPNMCSEDNASIIISQNVSSILFYATNGCTLVAANSKFDGSLIGEGVKVETNSTVQYDDLLQDAVFSLSDEGGWQISSFTEL